MVDTYPFEDKSTAGHEKALRKGRQVPDDGVNLAYFKSPELSPEENVVVIDVSKVTQENIVPEVTGDGIESIILPGGGLKKLYYANALGILEDKDGNQLINDEYPVVSDTFRENLDWTANPTVSYSINDSLLYVHKSRFFHIDFGGQSTSLGMYDYQGTIIKVIYSDGRDYVDVDGKRKYRIRLVRASVNVPSTYDQWAYRIYAYVDTDAEEDLYLTYNKVELDSSVTIHNQEIGFRELLNPEPVLSYQPEESMVVDPSFRKEKWYSSYPASLKDQVLGNTVQSVEGYKVVVPRKAISDPRIFQLFRWRLSCDFTANVKVDNIRKLGLIHGGVVVTNAHPHSHTPYVLYNLERSDANTNGVTFVNPMHEHDGKSRETDAYWNVNFDTVTFDDLKKFDFLVWSPQASSFNFFNYSTKIAHFIASGGTLFIDTNDYTYPTGLYPTSAAVEPRTGAVRSPGPKVKLSTRTHLVVGATNHPLINGDTLLGGWQIGATERSSLSYIQTMFDPGFTQCFMWNPSHDGFETLLLLGSLPITVAKRIGAGRIVLSTFGHLFSVNTLFDFANRTFLSSNRGLTVYKHANYDNFINTPLNAGAMKFVYNAALWSLQGNILDNTTVENYSTSWTVSTPWQSSWTITGDVLSDDEKQKYEFANLPEDATHTQSTWQRKLSSTKFKQLIESQMTKQMLFLTKTMKRNYYIEVTNNEVSVPVDGLNDNSLPYAWTTAYSPPFTVPADIGPYSVRDEEVKGTYEAGQYIVRQYPPKPYRGYVQGQFIATKNGLGVTTVNWIASGTATETVTITKTTPPSTTSRTSLVDFNWTSSSSKAMVTGGTKPYVGASVPLDAYIGQQFNYYEYNSWVFYGLVGRWQLGSQGEVPAFLQEALNRFQFFRTFTLPGGTALPVDGYYGPRTAAAIKAFQSAMGAKYVDGVVDAETLSLIGGQILRLNPLILVNTNNTDFTRFFLWAVDRMPVQNAVDGVSSSSLSKRSWISRGPAVISENFFLHLDQNYRIFGLSVIPFLEGAANTVNIFAEDVFSVSNVNQIHNWNSYYATYSDLPIRVASGQSHYFPFYAPKQGNVAAVTLVQDQASFGSSRMLGVRDIIAHAEVDTTLVVPGKTVITHETRDIEITATGTQTFSKVGTIAVHVHPKYTGGGTLSNIKWDRVTVDNSFVHAEISPSGLLELLPETQTVETTAGNPSHYVRGPIFPDSGTYYHMTPDGRLGPVPAHGFVSKEGGVQLLAHSDKTPYGFHAADGGPLFPDATGSNDAQRHYVKLTIRRLGVDNSIYLGFYDRKKQEFIQGPNDAPEISFIEYITRGANNIYVGVVSQYEIDTSAPLPLTNNSPLPYKWAMPVYGVLTHQNARISLQDPSPGLGRDDYWPVPVVPGQFHRVLDVPRRSQIQLTGWIRNYQGDQVDLFYGLPEARNQGWSSQFGPPNFDVKDETPITVTEELLQVRQPPILMVQWPTGYATPLADPVRPAIRVWTRTTISNPWVEVPWAQIKDVNASTGEVYLRTPLKSTDDNLCKVTYTAKRTNYDFKGDPSNSLNLNPFHSEDNSLVGAPIYVYLVPEYARDSQSNTITASLETRCLKFTTDPSLFDATLVQYDPTAIQLGVVYMSTSFNIDDLILVDTRSRGGGAADNLTSQEIVQTQNDGASYWDLNYSTGGSYQNGGFVLIRLPAELKDYMTDEDIFATIQRNITAGVAFRLEDLAGNSWE